MTEPDLPPLLQTVIDAVYATGGVGTLIEVALVLLMAGLALVRPQWGDAVFRRIEQRGEALARHPLRAILVVGALAVLLRAALLPWVGVPDPIVHDEQSLWLQGQTFAAGRIANPPHPLWEHFETFYVNQVPAYASMYFPGRGAPLALGWELGGEPWLGVWLTMVLLCMATTWMLQAWVSPGLALLGGLLVVVRLGVLSFWVNSYYGGAFTAFGAMLVVGALPRILARPRWTQGGVMGLGAAILMLTRPFEGALLCAPVAALLLWRFARPRQPLTRPALARVFAPAVLCVAAGAALLVGYNVATTGAALKTPYGLNRASYASAPAFLVSPPVASQERGPLHFRTYFDEEAEPYERTTNTFQAVRGLVGKVGYTWNFYAGLTLTAALFAGLWCCRRDRFLMPAAAFFTAGYALVTWNCPQYTAPLMPILMIIIMRGFGALRTARVGQRPSGLFLTRAMPLVAALGLLLSAFVASARPGLFDGSSPQAPCCRVVKENPRHTINGRLAAEPGRDLVLVRNGPSNPALFEVVYNDPDIDASQVVWAHSLDADRDRRLLQYFADRHHWVFEWSPQGGYRYTLVKVRDAGNGKPAVDAPVVGGPDLAPAG